jgi:hypothetical protein
MEENINEAVGKDYLDYIKKKLDSLNKESGFDPKQKGKEQKSKYEPDLMDPFDAMGASALRYIEEQRKKKEQEGK